VSRRKGGDAEIVKENYFNVMMINRVVEMRSELATIERRLKRTLREHPEYGDALEKAWDLLVKYRIPENRWIMDSLFQETGDGRPRDVDVLFYSELVFQLLKGHLFYTGIDVRCPPSPNPKEELLNELTLATVEPPFGISFTNGNHQRQASLLWHEPVTVHSHRAGRAHATKRLEPGCALLTVGYTRAIHTGLSLKEQRVLARWPHGHSFIYLLWTDQEDLFEGITDLSTWLNDRI
jgi:hypothetical protein